MDTQRSQESLDDVRLAIFRQHTQLAQLLEELEASADAVLSRRGDGAALRRALDALQARFVRHLDYEELHLASVLPRGSSGIAGEAAKALLGDHAEQRVRMSGLVHDRDVFGDPEGLAREARAFVHVLRKDLAEENARLRALG